VLGLHHHGVDAMRAKVHEQGKLTLDVMKESKTVDKVDATVGSEVDDKICISYKLRDFP